MKILTEQRKRKIKKAVLRLGIAAGIIVLLYLFLTSSFMICHCYLPIVSRYLDADISARSVRFYLFREQNIKVKDLEIRLQDHLSCKMVRFRASVDLRKLFTGLIKLDRVEAEKSELILRDFPDSGKKKWTNNLTQTRLQIDKADVKGFTVRHVPKNSDLFWRVHFDRILCNDLISAEDGKILFSSHLAWNLPDTSVLDFPLTGMITYELSEQIFPTKFACTVDSAAPVGSMLKQDLKDLSLHAEFSGRFDDDLDLFYLDSFHAEQRFRNNAPMRLAASGSFGTAEGNGSFHIQLTAKDSDLPLLRMLCAQKLNPEGVNFDLNAKLTFNGSDISCNAKLSGTAEKIQTKNSSVLKDLDYHAALNLDFQGQKNKLDFRALNTKITCGKKKEIRLLDLQTAGLFSLKKNNNETWDIDAENARFNAQISGFPLNILNPFIPLKIKSGTLDGEYVLEADNTRNRMDGKINAQVRDLIMQHKNFSVTVPAQFRFSSGLQTDGLTRLSTVALRDLKIEMFSGSKRHSLLELSGQYRLTKNTADLKGKFQISPVFLLKKCKFPFAEKLKENMKMDAADELWTGETKIRADLNRNTISMQGRSHIPTDIFPDIKLADKNISVNFNTDLEIGGENFTARIKTLTLNVPDRIGAKLSGSVQLPDFVADLDLKAEKMTAQTFRELHDLFDYRTTFHTRLLENLEYETLSSAMKIRWDKQNRFLYVDDAHATFHFGKDRSGSVSLDYPLIVDLNSGKMASTDLKITMQDLPFRVANYFIGKKSPNKVADAPVNGTLVLTIEDDTPDVPVKGDFTVGRVKFNIGKLDFDFGRTHIRGNGIFRNNFRALHYQDVQITVNRIGDPRNIHAMNVAMHGKMLFAAPFDAEHFFSFQGLDEHIFTHMLPGVTSPLKMKKMNSDGSLVLRIADHADRVSMRCEQNIRNAGLPYGVVHGRLFFDMLLLDKKIPEIELKNANFTLFSEDEKKIFDLSLAGKWQKIEGQHQTKCKVDSGVADWKAIRHLFVKQDPEKKGKKEDLSTRTKNTAKKSDKWIKEEPGRINFSGFSTEMDVDLKNWTYGDITLKANGTLTAQKNQLRTKDFQVTFNQDAPFKINASADVGCDDGWELGCDFKIKGLDIAPFAMELIKDEEKRKKFSGHVNNLKFRGKTKGITQQNLEKNLDMAFFAEFDHFSFPMIKEEKAGSLKLLMLPLTLLPQLVDNLPDPLARPVQKFISGDLWMALSGTKNLEISKAQVYLRSAKESPRTDLVFQKCLFTGNSYGFTTKKMIINPFSKKIDVESSLALSALKYPLQISGSIDEPQLDHKVLKTLSESFLSVFSSEQSELWDFIPPPEI